jgi:hypothetical protein
MSSCWVFRRHFQVFRPDDDVAGLALDLETESNGDQLLAPKSDACASSVKTNSLVGPAVAGAEQLDVATPVDGWNVAK